MGAIQSSLLSALGSVSHLALGLKGIKEVEKGRIASEAAAENTGQALINQLEDQEFAYTEKIEGVAKDQRDLQSEIHQSQEALESTDKNTISRAEKMQKEIADTEAATGMGADEIGEQVWEKARKSLTKAQYSKLRSYAALKERIGTLNRDQQALDNFKSRLEERVHQIHAQQMNIYRGGKK